MPSRDRSASRFRGVSVAGFTALLAVTAHGMASGKFPTGGTAALLVVLAAGMGAMVSASDRTAGPWPLLGVLALGQLGGHLVLSSGGHPVPRRDRPPGSRRPHAPGASRGGGARCDSGCGVRTALRGTVLGDPWLRPDRPASVDGPARVRGTTVRPSTAPRVAHRRVDIAPRSPGRLRTLTASPQSPCDTRKSEDVTPSA